MAHDIPQLSSRSPRALHRLPCELLLDIECRLPLADRLSLCLASKWFFNILSVEAIKTLKAQPIECREQSLQDFLQRLEPRLAASHYFCCDSKKLLTFASLPGPLSQDLWSLPHAGESSPDTYMPACLHRQFLASPKPNIPWHHGRLVTNRHLYGAPAGWPLNKLNVKGYDKIQADVTDPIGLGHHQWTVTVAARIHLNQLFLRVTHYLECESTNKMHFLLQHGRHDICAHCVTHKSFVDCVGEHRAEGLSRMISWLPRNSHGYCHVCLMDYELEIRWLQPGYPRASDQCAVTIYSYHNLGSFRNTKDWEWQAFNNKLHESYFYNPRSFSRLERNNKGWPPGSVRKGWEKGSAD